MSKFMLNDDDAINDVNPFVTHDFSLPGGVRKTGDFGDFTEVKIGGGIPEQKRSVYCDYGLCAESKTKCSMTRPLHPRRNIDCGFTKPTENVVIGVSNKSVPYVAICIFAMIILLTLMSARR